MQYIFKKNCIKRTRSAAIIALSFPLYVLSFFIPRSKNIWVFGAWFGYRYADNSRHVYEYVCANRKDIRAVWVSRSKAVVDSLIERGREACLICSLKGYWLCCRASVVISSNGKMDINRPAISRAKKIQLWHGIPLKKIDCVDRAVERNGRGIVGELLKLLSNVLVSVKRRLFPFVLENWDHITSTSELISERMASAYGVSLSKVMVTGYPRNDILLSGDGHVSCELLDIIRSRGTDRIVLYAPTFRDRYEDNVALFNGLDPKELESVLKKHNALFMIKMHPVFRASDMAIKDIEGKYVYWVRDNDVSELNDLLPLVNVLITDYSGAYLDYLLLDRPIIFTPFDLDRYQRCDRELYEDYYEATPGAKCNDWEAVYAVLDNILKGGDGFVSERQKAIRKYHFYRDPNSSKRVFELAHSLILR